MQKRIGSTNRAQGGPYRTVTHQLRLVGKKVMITPSPKNESKFARNIKDRLTSLGDSAVSKFIRRQNAHDLKMYIRSWTSAFSRCAGMNERRNALLGQVDVAMVKAGLK